MYPDIPFDGLTWPITQHSGVISEEIVRGLINACIEFHGETVNSNSINNYIVAHGLLTENFRADSNRVDAWRDYQQILSEFGLIYSTRISNRIVLTPIAIAFSDGDITYKELITLQALRYQYPNGHKTQISPSLRTSYEETGRSFVFSNVAEMQANMGILIRPVVAIWQILYSLYLKGERATLSVDELQTYVVRCLRNTDVVFCVDSIIKSRNSNYSLSPLRRARRNMQDWIKILIQTPLFCSVNSGLDSIGLSAFSINQAEAINGICNHLCDPGTFWIYNGNESFKAEWFDFYGQIDLGTNWIPNQEDETDKREEEGLDDFETHNGQRDDVRNIELQSFRPMFIHTETSNRRVVSIYDYKKSEVGRRLHDNMVNLIASRCIEKGADVSFDPRTVDLYVKYKSKEFLVEVKSITPSNFIARLRTAIGQVSQYDYLMHRNSETRGRLGLAFTANIPSKDWCIPFITDYMDMDLLYMDSNLLTIKSQSGLSQELYG